MVDTFKQPNIKGAILAGGRASRMGGIPKGMLVDESGQPIIVHLINQMRLAGIEDIVIAANDPTPYRDLGFQTIPDLQQGTGPIAGIAEVLKHYQDKCDGTMFMPCDVPNMTARELITLREAFLRSTENIVFAETDDFFWHPLCAVVHNDMATQITLAIDHGQRKVQDLWRQLGAKSVKFAEAEAFMNMNSFSDVNRWRGNTSEKTLCRSYII
jgi:molybdopterin-guanine dinucleotide biosynthesis protein A